MNIIYAKNPTDVENVLNKLPFLKAIYYFSNTGNLIHTLRYNIYQHIFLGHGDSDKAASAHKFSVYTMRYGLQVRLISIDSKTEFKTAHIDFIKVGRPNLKHIVKNTVNKEDKLNEQISKITYFPTWEGTL